MKSKRKFSISLDNNIFEKMKAVAEREDISVNSLINQALENYIVWSPHKTDFIPIRKALIAKLLDKFSHDEMESIATNIALTKNKDTVLQITDKFDGPNTIKTAEMWLRLTGFPYSYEVRDTTHRFVVLHDLGEKWSVYLTRLLSVSLSQFDINPKYEYTDKLFSIIIDISKPKNGKSARAGK